MDQIFSRNVALVHVIGSNLLALRVIVVDDYGKVFGAKGGTEYPF